VSVKDALEIIAAGNTDPDRMVELAQQALKTLNGATK
jgi:predicted Zn-dependent peptidase